MSADAERYALLFQAIEEGAARSRPISARYVRRRISHTPPSSPLNHLRQRPIPPLLPAAPPTLMLQVLRLESPVEGTRNSLFGWGETPELQENTSSEENTCGSVSPPKFEAINELEVFSADGFPNDFSVEW